MNTPIIYKLLGMVLLALAGAFGLCVIAGLANGETFADQSLQAFATSIGITFALAALFLLLGRNGQARLFRREALCVIGLSWILATIVGAIPYLLIVEQCDLSDAIFESSSGLTTTGATAFPKFYEFPESLLFWRSLSQWVGGLGVVVFFVAILSSLGAGAKILFSNESSGTSADFDHGRIQSGAFYLMLYYLGLSVTCMVAYVMGGMNWFQAINHAMTTIATGGFSTEPTSIQHFQSATIEWISIVFMTISGTTFVFAIRLLRGRTKGLARHNEIYWFYVILLTSTALLTLYLVEFTGELPDHNSIRAAAFQAVSIMTTTGYTTMDYDTWLPSAKMLLLILMLIGGCSGSTSGGVKVVRVVIALRAAAQSVTQSFRPNVTKPMRMGGQTLSQGTINSVILFLMLMLFLVVASMLFVVSNEPELTFVASFSAVQATLFNIGPGFDAFGPTQNFHFLRDSTKVFLSLLMILGRLELYAVLVLFSPSVWKRFS